jgi:hypothetical protein
MSKRRNVVGAALASSLALGALTLGQGFAQADPAPQANDVVGVGSDIIQNSVNFLADGFTDGTLGYNSAGNQNRIFNFDSVGDANGRNAFTDPSISTSTKLNATVQLQAGTSPVQRPNGGGAGLTALYTDTKHYIDFARTPNKPVQATATASGGVGALDTIQFAEDKQYIATATTTNAPSYLTANDLYNIYTGVYTTWGQVPNYLTRGGSSAGATETIHAKIPQNGAGVLTIFLAAVNAGRTTGGTDLTLANSTNATQVQQNDPSTIAGDPNAIVPFPKGRYQLLGAGFFTNPDKAYNPAANSADSSYVLGNSTIKLQVPGTGGADASTTYQATIPYYVVFRHSDIATAGGWQPGSTLNWVKTLFYNPDYDPGATDNTVPAPWVASPAATALLTKIGLTPVYHHFGTDNALDY